MKNMNVSAIVLACVVGLLGSCSRDVPADEAPGVGATRPGKDAESKAESKAAPATIADLPPDGRPLYDFLLREIAELVNKVPCSCCPYKLAGCYQGHCPTTCGPCNKIGRAVYAWHKQGLTDDAILERVAQRFPKTRRR